MYWSVDSPRGPPPGQPRGPRGICQNLSWRCFLLEGVGENITLVHGDCTKVPLPWGSLLWGQPSSTLSTIPRCSLKTLHVRVLNDFCHNKYMYASFQPGLEINFVEYWSIWPPQSDFNWPNCKFYWPHVRLNLNDKCFCYLVCNKYNF